MSDYTKGLKIKFYLKSGNIIRNVEEKKNKTKNIVYSYILTIKLLLILKLYILKNCVLKIWTFLF